MAYDSDTVFTDTLTLTAEIVASYFGKASHVSASEIPAIIKSVRAALSGSGAWRNLFPADSFIYLGETDLPNAQDGGFEQVVMNCTRAVIYIAALAALDGNDL